MKKILMVDDNPTNLKAAAEVLKSSYELSMAKSGKQALNYLKKEKPDLILLDIMMPEMDGYETMEQIKLNPESANIPIIFLTADHEQDSEQKGIRMGAMDYITKPFEAKAMLGRIEQVLKMEELRKGFSGAVMGETEGSVQEAAAEYAAESEAADIRAMIRHVDHTRLNAFATREDIFKLCEEALTLDTASVCIPPGYVKDVKEKYGDRLTICTVIGFPLGYNTTVSKIFECENAIINGADEIDCVINIGRMKGGEYDYVLQELQALRHSCRGKVLKVIIESCYLSEAEIIKACELVTEAGADYIKTSTGFGTAGATPECVKIMKEHIGEGVKIKAAGGIRTKEALAEYISLGCDRVGASATRKFLEEV